MAAHNTALGNTEAMYWPGSDINFCSFLHSLNKIDRLALDLWF